MTRESREDDFLPKKSMKYSIIFPFSSPPTKDSRRTSSNWASRFSQQITRATIIFVSPKLSHQDALKITSSSLKLYARLSPMYVPATSVPRV